MVGRRMKMPAPALDSKRNARSGFCQAGRLPLSDHAVVPQVSDR
jgi:hypothetical protein